MKKILSLGTGRLWLNVNKEFEDKFPKEDKLEIYHIDNIYKNSYEEDGLDTEKTTTFLCEDDIFTFLEEYPKRDFDVISARRVFEHIPREKIAYLLYLLKEVASPEAELEIVVPDFVRVFESLKTLDEVLCSGKMESCELLDTVSLFERGMINIHTEIFNEPNDPHQSVWTVGLAKYYFSIEDYWVLTNFKHIELDGRSWYLELIAKINDVIH